MSNRLVESLEVQPYFVPIWLTISPKGEAVVSIEWEKRWIPVIRELHIGGVTSHIVEPNGIRAAINRALPLSEEPEP